MKLNPELKEIRGQILALDPLPNLNKVFKLVHQSEREKNVTGNIQGTVEMSAFTAQRGRRFQGENSCPKRDFKKGKLEKMKLVCEHCGKRGHNVKTGCFDLIGYPEWFKRGKTKIVANVEKEEEAESPLDFEEEEEMQLNPQFVNAVAKQMAKMMSKASGSNKGEENYSSSCNFAGKIYASNVSTDNSYDEGWIMDSGASDHMAWKENMFDCLSKLQKAVKIKLPDGTLKKVDKIGKIRVNENLELCNVLFVPDFKHNLMSVSKLIEEQGLCVCFNNEGCEFQDHSSKKMVAQAKERDGLYILDKGEGRLKNNEVILNNVILDNKGNKNAVTIDVMHARLGHGSLSKLRHLDFCNCKNVKTFFCDTCGCAKHHRLPFNKSKSIAKETFNLLHVDLWGPYKVANVTGDRYFLTIVDDYSRTTWTTLLNVKGKVKNIIKNFLAYVENQFNGRVRIIRSDNGTEIVPSYCEKIFSKRGIIHQKSVIGVPQQNGRVERKRRTLLEMARAIRIHEGLPKFLWGECLLAATHIINLLPSVVINWQTPYERLMKQKPSYDHLRIIGCLCYASKDQRKGISLMKGGQDVCWLDILMLKRGIRCMT
ncbi:Retrovirus-related Pol polyprotein from transposon RE2 [Bienertia sinuspersici]